MSALVPQLSPLLCPPRVWQVFVDMQVPPACLQALPTFAVFWKFSMFPEKIRIITTNTTMTIIAMIIVLRGSPCPFLLFILIKQFYDLPVTQHFAVELVPQLAVTVWPPRSPQVWLDMHTPPACLQSFPTFVVFWKFSILPVKISIITTRTTITIIAMIIVLSGSPCPFLFSCCFILIYECIHTLFAPQSDWLVVVQSNFGLYFCIAWQYVVETQLPPEFWHCTPWFAVF